MNVIELGEGPPIVFVHGLSGCWQNWLEQLPVLAEKHRVVALDLPGFGYSEMPREQITISLYGRVLDRVMDVLGIDAAAVVGNSMGGFTAAELAIAFPQRVERLVLAAPAGISSYNNQAAMRWALWIRRMWPLLAVQANWVAAHADAVARWPRLRDATMYVPVLYPSRLPAALAAEQLRATGKPGFVPALEANLNYDFRDRLPEIVCPTLVVWGEQDRLITVRDADVYTELIPDARKVIFEDTGHAPMLERPARFNALLEQFLAE
ncbi:MAG TPA: alpha/beta hydrolase [Solirubrobacteraceae bacterium]|nr:alpha/beta hydrolase [Solirubrobacteraceae bacterium]